MPYAEFQNEDGFVDKVSGSHVEVIMIPEDDPSIVLVSAVSSVNWTDDLEVIPIEEAGNEGVDEIVQGRHSGSGSMQLFFTPERNDALPTRANFIGRKFTVFEQMADERPGAGEILNAFTGVAISRVGSGHGARGAKTFDLAFSYESRKNGEEYATEAGLL